MNIEFVKQGNAYVAEFKVEADFNLHIEKDKNGHITLYQRTSEGGKYALLEEFGYQDGKLVYESDAAGLIYPKYIKVVSAVLPTYAVVTSAGEVTEIKSQTKEIEVTANGTTEVTPDTGFAYLNSVKVKTNVAQSGEGGSASSVEYLDVSGVDEYIKQTLLLFSLYAKVPHDVIIDMSEGGNQSTITLNASIVPSSQHSSIMGKLGMTSVHIGTFLSGITALGFDFSQKIVMQGQTMTLNEYFTMLGGKEMIDAIPRITEEEFYSFNTSE
jgi:hypothetical protein